MKISVIAAISTNDVIGWNGKLPWRLSTDLREFRRRTEGHHVIMGSGTYESIGKALPNRVNVVVSRRANFSLPDAFVIPTIGQAIQFAFNSGDTEVFIIGGSEIFRIGLPYADRMYITKVYATVGGDTYFPPVNWDEWKLISTEEHDADSKNEYPFSFCVYERKDF